MLRAVQTLLDDGLAAPILLGRRAVIEQRVRELGLRLDLGESGARARSRPSTTAVFAPLVRDLPAPGRTPRHAARCGGPARAHAPDAWPPRCCCTQARPTRRSAAAPATGGGTCSTSCRSSPAAPRSSRIYALSCLILHSGARFICDTHMNVDPTAEQIAEMTLLAAEAVRSCFGITPKAALLSHSSFGASNSPSARKMRQALAMIRARDAGPGNRRRDARRRGADRGRSATAPSPDSRLHGRRQPADHAVARRRQHLLQPAEGGRRRAAGGAAAAGHERSRCTWWCRASPRAAS